MRLCRFELRNFKGIRNGSFEWQDIAVLIGENNVGKSSVLQALQCFLGGAQLKDKALFCESLSGIERSLELIGHFCDLSQEEQESPAVRGRMDDGKWILKKKFWSEIDGNAQLVWKEQYYSFSRLERLRNWPENESTWGSFSEEYRPLIEQIPNRGARPTNQARDVLRSLIREQRPDMIELEEPDWTPNPGGGGNWKSNANAILPRWIYVQAVHDAADESTSKDTSTYGKIVNLIVEKRFVQRPEIVQLKKNIEAVLRLFSPDPDHPEIQAEEIRSVQAKINAKLSEVIGGTVAIRTTEVDIEPILLPSTHLVIRDGPGRIETTPEHQGHGLQRTLVMTLLQILAEIQSEPEVGAEPGKPAELRRSVILAVEEPELYMHPQMERKMRDVLYRLSTQPNFQVICTTHSPVFIDVEKSHKSLVRIEKDAHGVVSFHQVSEDALPGDVTQEESNRIKFIATFNSAINEVFFARRVALLEERSALVALHQAAELTGLFRRHMTLRRDVMLIDCGGKQCIPYFQRILNHFEIPYIVVHDEDRGNADSQKTTQTITMLLTTPKWTNLRHMFSPTDLEGVLGHAAANDKPYRAMKRIQELHSQNAIPEAFMSALNMVYFGAPVEPGGAAAP